MKRTVVHGVGAVLLAAMVVVVGCVGDEPAGAGTTPPIEPEAGSPDTAPACMDVCPEGATRCSGTAGLETCARAGACLAWGTAAPCGADTICCGIACIANDATNCFACGAACTGSTPACLPTPKKCGCALSACTPNNQGCDKTTGTCVDCKVLPAATADFYVDRASFAGGTGSEACPFLTIKQAIAAANASSAPEKTIHVGPGLYDEAAGETFPMTLRSVSIVGAGAGKTIIRGATTNSRLAGQFPAAMRLTMLVGHATAKTNVSGVTIEPPSPLTDGVAVLCDTGNTVQTAAGVNPDGNTVFKNVSIGPGFDGDGAILVGPSLLTGCNFVIEGSTITGGKRGIFAAGAGNVAIVSEEGYVALRVGDNTAAGANTFKNVKFPAGAPTQGQAVELYDKMHSAKILRNTFEGNLYGLVSQVHSQSEPKIIVNGNTFKNNISFGIWALNQTTITELFDNVFEGTNTILVTPTVSRQLGVGLHLEQDRATVELTPAVLSARRNRFIGNEIGVLFTGIVNMNQVSDFGKTGSPGANVFSCNSSLHAGVVGGDVVVAYDNRGAAAALTFEGNEWDNVSPSTAGNGGDLLTSTAVNVTVSTANATKVATATCAGGHVK